MLSNQVQDEVTFELPAEALEYTPAGRLREHAHVRPDAVALVCDDDSLTFAELDRRSSQAAQALLAAGVGLEDRVGFIGLNSNEYFVLLFGCAKAGAVNVAVNWRLAVPEMEFIVNDAECKVLVVDAAFSPQLDELESRLKTVSKIVVIGEHPKHKGFDAWVGSQEPVDPGHEAGPHDVALQLYTSGTTGLPKGAMITNLNVGAIVGLSGAEFELDEKSVVLVCLPVFHIGGCGWALLAALASGGTSVVLKAALPDLILDAIEKHRMTHLLLVPALMNFINQVPGVEQRDLSAVRHLVYGASPITEPVLRDSIKTFPTAKFWQAYGLTETTGGIACLLPEDHDPDGPKSYLLRSAGLPWPWVGVRVVDPATGLDQPRGTVGEIWIRSAQNMKGYWHRDDDNKSALLEGGWFRSGDAGYLDADGYIFLTDRIKDMIVSGGENIYPIEIENVLAEHPAVADVGVIGVPSDKWGETVKAVVVLRPAASVSADDLIAYCRTRLAGFKCPTSVDFVAELPRTPSGKILKRELREPYWQGRQRRIN